jgi:hypothetical protein
MAHFTHILVDMLGDGEIAVYELNNAPEGGLFYYMVDRDTWSICRTRRPTLFVNTDMDVQFPRLDRYLRQMLDMLPDNEDGSLLFSVRGVARFNDGFHFVMAGLSFVAGVEYGVPLDGADPASLMVQACDTGALPEDVHPIVQNAWLKNTKYSETRFNSLKRARALLIECLTPSQREELAEHDRFHTRGADGHQYLIKRGFGHNVYRLDPDGTPVAEYCIIISDWSIPDYDLMLAQKLLLDTAPGEFEAVSNIRLLNRLRL